MPWYLREETELLTGKTSNGLVYRSEEGEFVIPADAAEELAQALGSIERKRKGEGTKLAAVFPFEDSTMGQTPISAPSLAPDIKQKYANPPLRAPTGRILSQVQLEESGAEAKDTNFSLQSGFDDGSQWKIACPEGEDE